MSFWSTRQLPHLRASLDTHTRIYLPLYFPSIYTKQVRWLSQERPGHPSTHMHVDESIRPCLHAHFLRRVRVSVNFQFP